MTEISVLSFQNLIIPLAFLLVFIVMLVLLILNTIKLNRLQRKYKRFMSGSGEMSIEQVLSDCIRRIEKHELVHMNTKRNIENIEDMVSTCVQKVGVVRFNAYDKVGSDLSYAVALLDGNNNGVVICSLFSRDSCTTYAKPLTEGVSKYSLSNEEKEAVQKAMKSNS
jgi:hypothetical protein